MVKEVARHIHWMWSCNLLSDLGVRISSGDAEQWLASTPAHLLAEVARVVTFPGDWVPPRFAQDIAHWMLSSGGNSGIYKKPSGLPDWEFDGYTLGYDGVVYLRGVALGSVTEVTGIEWFTPEDFSHLRERLLEIWPVGDEAETDGPEDVMTSRGYVTLHPDGDVVQHGMILMRVTLPDWEFHVQVSNDAEQA